MGCKKQQQLRGHIPIISRLLGPGAAATGSWIAGGGLVTGGAAVMLVSLVTGSNLRILQILHHSAEQQRAQI